MAEVDTKTGICAFYSEQRVLPRTLMKGTGGMVEAGEEFTPRHPAEDEATYKIRLKGTTLFNAFEDAVKSMSGKVLAKDVVLEDDTPEVIVEYAKNIDGQGRNLTAFTLDAFREAMVDGISFIFVDFPRVQAAVEGEEPFLSDQIAQGARPNSILYLADQIIGFKHQNMNGAEVLTEIRIFEQVTEPDGQWGEVTHDQIRVLRPGSFELWRKLSDGVTVTWILFDTGFTSLQYIPIVPVYTNRKGYMVGEPPLKALAELNLEHWISSSEQRKALMFERFAMIVLTGVQSNTEIDVGPDVLIKLQDPECKWGKIESTGKGIEAGRLDLEAIERKMQHVGMTIQVQNGSGDVTATAASIDSEEANAALLAAAGALEDSLDAMLQIFADYLSLPSGGSASVNKAFGRRPSTASVQDLISLYNSGLLDNETVLNELRVRGDISPDIDVVELLEKIKNSAPNLLKEQLLKGEEEDDDNRF